MNGISFIVRVRDEEETIEESLRSLFDLTIPYEVVVVLHRCTDRSQEIVEALAIDHPNIKVYTYDHEVSRAGYGMLATDQTSNHSIVEYYNWCMNKSSLYWKFKWDADFIASPNLLTYLNSRSWEPRIEAITLCAVNSTHSNREAYLIGGFIKYVKYMFWETPHFQSGVRTTLPDNVCIHHKSELSVMKPYWNNTPWYENEVSDEATLVRGRIAKLTEEFGPEIRGMARASNTECMKQFHLIKTTPPSYVNLYH
jgi:glycosyltransferase involved in cell wall biosynthesis